MDQQWKGPVEVNYGKVLSLSSIIWMVDQLNNYFYNSNHLSSIIRLPQPWIFIAIEVLHYYALPGQNALGYRL